MKQRLAILGSTGSIGMQTLDVVRENPDRFEVRVLTAARNWQRLAQQARACDADAAVIADERCYGPLREALADTDIKVYAGTDAVAQVAAAGDTDTIVNALVGYAGLAPTVAALDKGKKLALANKESLVVGGQYVMRLAAERRAPILPVDSEHSAIFQCLMGERAPVRRLIVTCSGGSLRDLPREALADVTPEQALRHPQWEMGAKITIDSSTLVNKGFEVIEAHWLFGTPAERISVIQHPQAVVHSMVEFEDGAVKAQLGAPDMRMPISFALMYPDRAHRPSEQFDFLAHPQLTFEEVDRTKYPALDIAYDCLRRGGTAACTMNGANEVAVAAFLDRKCRYTDIVRTIEHARPGDARRPPRFGRLCRGGCRGARSGARLAEALIRRREKRIAARTAAFVRGVSSGRIQRRTPVRALPRPETEQKSKDRARRKRPRRLPTPNRAQPEPLPGNGRDPATASEKRLFGPLGSSRGPQTEEGAEIADRRPELRNTNRAMRTADRKRAIGNREWRRSGNGQRARSRSRQAARNPRPDRRIAGPPVRIRKATAPDRPARPEGLPGRENDNIRK